MKTIPLCTQDIRRLVQRDANPRYLILPRNMAFEIALQVDDALYEKIELDAFLAENIFLEVSKVYKASLKKIVNVTRFHDGRMATGNRGRIARQWETDVARYFEEAKTAVIEAAKRQIQAWQKTRKDRTNYKIKAAVKLTVGSCSVVASSVGVVASSASGGAGLVVAIYALVKASLNLFRQIADLCKKLEKIEKRLANNLKKLKAEYEKASKAQVARRELGTALLERVFTSVLTGFARSISSCEKDAELFHGKLKGLEVKASDLGTQLNKLIDKQSELDRLLGTVVPRELQRVRYRSRRLKKLNKKLEKLVKQTAKQVTRSEELFKRVKASQARQKIYVQALKQLQAKKPGWVKYAESATVLLDWAAGAGFTDYSDLTSILVLVDSIGADLDDMLTEELI